MIMYKNKDYHFTEIFMDSMIWCLGTVAEYYQGEISVGDPSETGVAISW